MLNYIKCARNIWSAVKTVNMLGWRKKRDFEKHKIAVMQDEVAKVSQEIGAAGEKRQSRTTPWYSSQLIPAHVNLSFNVEPAQNPCWLYFHVLFRQVSAGDWLYTWLPYSYFFLWINIYSGPSVERLAVCTCSQVVYRIFFILVSLYFSLFLSLALSLFPFFPLSVFTCLSVSCHPNPLHQWLSFSPTLS